MVLRSRVLQGKRDEVPIKLRNIYIFHDEQQPINGPNMETWLLGFSAISFLHDPFEYIPGI